MNITGEHSAYIRNIIFTFTSVNSDDIRGIVYDGTLYFLINFGILYRVELKGFPREIICCFQRNTDNPNSFINEDMIIDNPTLFNNVFEKLHILNYTSRIPIYNNDDCTDDEQINSIQNLRAGDGSVKFFIDSALNHRSFVMMSKQMIKMNKGDKLSVKAYDADYSRILYNFTIFKKKFGLNVDLFLLTNDVHSNYGR